MRSTSGLALLSLVSSASALTWCSELSHCSEKHAIHANRTSICHNSTHCDIDCMSSTTSRCSVTNDLICTSRPQGICASASEPCYFDPNCLKGGLGCNAGGRGSQCRFCEFFAVPPLNCIFIAPDR